MQDIVQRFIFEDLPIRGEVVSLEQTWQEILQRNDYPAGLKHILGELVAAAALLTANLKFDGTLILQLHGKGAVKLIVVECTHDLTIRATAKWDDSEYLTDAPIKTLLQEGHFVITLDSKGEKASYQGIVGLEGNSIAEMIMHYMRHSEQLETLLWLSANDERVAGLLLQRMPEEAPRLSEEAEEESDDWVRIQMLSQTVTPEELLLLDSTTLLRRLFHEEDVRVFEPAHTRFLCTCSADKVGRMLQMLGPEEIQSIVNERGIVEVQCEFCNAHYVYDKVDVASLFAGSIQITPISTKQ